MGKGAHWEPSAPPEPAQCRKCHACHAKWRSMSPSATHLSTFLSASLKTKLFCETSSFFEVDRIKNEAILRDFLNYCELDNIKKEATMRDFLQKWKVECKADGLVSRHFAIFPIHLSKLCACHEKVMPGHTKCCTCHAKSSQQT